MAKGEQKIREDDVSIHQLCGTCMKKKVLVGKFFFFAQKTLSTWKPFQYTTFITKNFCNGWSGAYEL